MGNEQVFPSFNRLDPADKIGNQTSSAKHTSPIMSRSDFHKIVVPWNCHCGREQNRYKRCPCGLPKDQVIKIGDWFCPQCHPVIFNRAREYRCRQCGIFNPKIVSISSPLHLSSLGKLQVFNPVQSPQPSPSRDLGLKIKPLEMQSPETFPLKLPEDPHECELCFDQTKEMTFVPCGHGVCKLCLDKFKIVSDTICPFCTLPLIMVIPRR